MMAKKKITSGEMLTDVKDGFTDAELMQKYGLSASALQSCFNKMVAAGLISKNELDTRVPEMERTVELGLNICPACGHMHDKDFKKCERCGLEMALAQKRMAAEKSAQQSRKPPPKSRTGPRQTSVGPVQLPNLTEIAPSGDYPELSQTAKHCNYLGIAALASYGVLVVALFAVFYLFPSGASLSVTQSFFAVLILQLPAIAVVLTLFLSLRALAESIRVFEQVTASLMKRTR